MNTIQWILLVWITLNALIQFGRGCARHKRTYTVKDGVLGIVESAIAIWLLASL